MFATTNGAAGGSPGARHRRKRGHPRKPRVPGTRSWPLGSRRLPRCLAPAVGPFGGAFHRGAWHPQLALVASRPVGIPRLADGGACVRRAWLAGVTPVPGTGSRPEAGGPRLVVRAWLWRYGIQPRRECEAARGMPQPRCRDELASPLGRCRLCRCLRRLVLWAWTAGRRTSPARLAGFTRGARTAGAGCSAPISAFGVGGFDVLASGRTRRRLITLVCRRFWRPNEENGDPVWRHAAPHSGLRRAPDSTPALRLADSGGWARTTDLRVMSPTL